MNLYRVLGRLDTWELVYLGVILGIAVQQWIQDDGPTRTTREQMTLNEDDLRRLEDGGSLALPRWHGNELHLRGDVVIDAPGSQSDQSDTEDGC